MLESVTRTHKEHYPQTHLEECKYEVKIKKMESLIEPYDLDLSSSDESDSESDNGSDNDESND